MICSLVSLLIVVPSERAGKSDQSRTNARVPTLKSVVGEPRDRRESERSNESPREVVYHWRAFMLNFMR